MNTLGFALLAAALFGRNAKLAWAAALGAILPDVPSLSIFAVFKLIGIADIVTFGLLFWQDWWRKAEAVGHSILLWGLLLAAMVLLRERRSLSAAAIDRWTWPVIFAAGGGLHAIVNALCIQRGPANLIRPGASLPATALFPSLPIGPTAGIIQLAISIICFIVLVRRFNTWPAWATLPAALLFTYAFPPQL